MKRISRYVLLTLFGILLLGGTGAYAGNGGNNQGGNNQGGNGQGQNNQGGNNQGDNNQGSPNDGGTWANGGGTAPIDAGIVLLLGAGVGLGIVKARRRNLA